MVNRDGALVEVKIKDCGQQVIFKRKCNLSDKKSLKRLMEYLSSFSGSNISEIMSQPLEEEKWFE